jgi:hypothetical protein
MRFRLGEESMPFIACGSDASGREVASGGGAFITFKANIFVGEAMELGAISIKEGRRHRQRLIAHRGGSRRA